jgi:hypothetical protein
MIFDRLSVPVILGPTRRSDRRPPDKILDDPLRDVAFAFGLRSKIKLRLHSGMPYSQLELKHCPTSTVGDNCTRTPNNKRKDYSIQRAFLRSASQLASPITVRKAI